MASPAVVGVEVAALGPKTTARVAQVTARDGIVLEQLIRSYASGMPGPQVITGDYEASIQYRGTQLVGGVMVECHVSSDEPFAHRLEYGFVGVDALGRTVQEAPRPHFAPAMARLSVVYPADVATAVTEALAE
jgi:hypothetical protein